MTVHIKLAQGLTQSTLNQAHPTLPTRTLGINTLQLTRVEIKALGGNLLAQQPCARVQHMPDNPGPHILKLAFLPHLSGLRQVVRLTHNNLTVKEALTHHLSGCRRPGLKRQTLRARDHISPVHGVIHGLNVTATHRIPVPGRQRRLQLHNGLGNLRSLAAQTLIIAT